MTLVGQDDLVENSECGKYLITNRRKSYKSGRDAECIKERYDRVAAIIIATIDGTKNNCVQETHKKSVTCDISNTRKELTKLKEPEIRVEPSSINMLQL